MSLDSSTPEHTEKILVGTIEVVFSVDILPEDTPLSGNVMASGDAKIDQEAEQEIFQRMANGEQWAWCTVRVRASAEGFVGIDCLGCCSYKDVKDFVVEGGYYPDMKKQAFSNLLANLFRAEQHGDRARNLRRVLALGSIDV
jgi:hypothetical protein